MSEGAALVRFHDWRAHGLMAVPVSIGRFQPELIALDREMVS